MKRLHFWNRRICLGTSLSQCPSVGLCDACQ